MVKAREGPQTTSVLVAGLGRDGAVTLDQRESSARSRSGKALEAWHLAVFASADADNDRARADSDTAPSALPSSLRKAGRILRRRAGMDTRRGAERLNAIRLRFSINTHLDDRGLRRPAEIGQAVGLPAVEAVRLLNRRQYRDGDVEALRGVAERLGLTQTASGHWMALTDEAADSAPPRGD
jgi:hypothetical protein